MKKTKLVIIGLVVFLLTVSSVYAQTQSPGKPDSGRLKESIYKELTEAFGKKGIQALIIETALPEIEDRIEEVLQSNGKPMHITDIRATLIRIGVPLPGRGDEANIILRLRRASERFVRTGRGTYALTAWKIPEYSPAPSRKRVRRRRRTVP